MLQAQYTNREFLFTDAGLEAVFEVFDNLHDAASEGQLQEVTALDNRELVGWLRELVFTAQETISEIEKCNARAARSEPILRIVK
ncbi:MAG: hypothetical protein J0L63_12390 [Anaerolineae bacterium]|nr:hypothetical protein [Anaerolineae bacterium]MBN8619700.1 hypothetical protein [Anaerolineae bacterium]